MNMVLDVRAPTPMPTRRLTSPLGRRRGARTIQRLSRVAGARSGPATNACGLPFHPNASDTTVARLEPDLVR